MVAVEWLRGWSAYMALRAVRRMAVVLERYANPFTTDFRRCTGCGATPFEVEEGGHSVLVDQVISGSVPWTSAVRPDHVPLLEGRWEARECPNACACEPQCFTVADHWSKVAPRESLEAVP